MNRLAISVATSLLLLLAGALTAAAETPQPTPAPATLVPPAQANPTPAPTPVTNRDYVLGTTGDDVKAFKQRLQDLGYFKQATKLNGKVSETTLERVNQLLADNGMEPVTVITTEIQAMIFARDDLAIAPTPTPSPTPETFRMPQGTPTLPALDSEGFLADADGEYVFADDTDGLWYYITDTLYINIRRYNDPQTENIWLETEVRTRGAEQMLSFLTATENTYRKPVAIARANHAVLAITDDYFARRKYGVVIRNGVIYRDKIRTTSKSYPIGDTMAVYKDGSLCVYDYDAYTAEEYLALGAVQVFSFGPWLVHEGTINPKILQSTYMPYHEPRCALGMIEPGHYVILTVDGRYDGAEGVMFPWLAQRLREVGVTEAINLDGGGTTALVFMGNQISRVSGAKADGTNTRRVACMLGFGTSDAVPE